MSYNGIGLSTVRGSGTNGFVQRNLSAVRRIRDKVGMLSEDQADDLRFEKKPNLELLEHDRKRRVELKCMELQDLMEEQGYDEEEITKKVNSYRQMLSESQECLPGKEDASGRPIATETHQIAEMKEKENEALRSAFGIRKDYVKGSAFNKFDMPPNKDEEGAKKYKFVRTPSRSPSPSHSKAKKKNERKERKRSYDVSDSRSPSPSHSRSKKKNERKERKRSYDESDRPRKKSKKKAVSDSESPDSDDSSPERHSKKSKHSKHHKKKDKHSKHSKHKKSKKSRRRSYSESSDDS